MLEDDLYLNLRLYKQEQEDIRAAIMADKIVSRMLKENIESGMAHLNLSRRAKNRLFKVLRLSEPCVSLALKKKLYG